MTRVAGQAERTNTNTIINTTVHDHVARVYQMSQISLSAKFLVTKNCHFIGEFSSRKLPDFGNLYL